MLSFLTSLFVRPPKDVSGEVLNTHHVTVAIWRKLSNEEKARFNELYETFRDPVWYPMPLALKSSAGMRNIVAHNLALKVVEDERRIFKLRR